ncbi:glycosyltransferase family 39 protein [Candidatus Omnitrophota bacterium]
MKFGISALTINDKHFVFLLLAIMVAVALSVLPFPAVSPVLILLFGIWIGVLIVSIFAPDDFKYLLNIYLFGFGLRAFLSFLFYISSFVLKSNYSPGFIFPNDGWSYSVQGWEILKFAERGIKITMQTFMSDPNMKDFILSGNITQYDYYTSHVYSISGYSPVTLFFISSLAGSVVILFIYLIARGLFSKNVARISGIFVCLWPSFILWSTQNLKEPIITMFICILLWSIFNIYKHPFPGFLLISAISIWGLLKISFPYAVIVICAILAAGLFLHTVHMFKNKFISVIIMCAFLLIGVFFFKEKISSFIFKEKTFSIGSYESVFKFIDFQRKNRAYGALKFFKNTDVSSLSRLALFAPLGLLFVIFAPFPWQIGSFAQIIAVPEMILFYILIPFTLRGIIFAYKKRFNQSILLLSIISGVMLFLAAVEGNAGTLFRHRAPVFCLLFIFTALGVSLKTKKWLRLYT